MSSMNGKRIVAVVSLGEGVAPVIFTDSRRLFDYMETERDYYRAEFVYCGTKDGAAVFERRTRV